MQLWPEIFHPQTAPATLKAQPSKKVGNTEQRRLAIRLSTAKLTTQNKPTRTSHAGLLILAPMVAAPSPPFRIASPLDLSDLPLPSHSSHLFGDHRAACAQSGIFRSRGRPLSATPTNTTAALRSKGTAFLHGMDTTLVSPLTRERQPRRRAGRFARRRKEGRNLPRTPQQPTLPLRGACNRGWG